MPLSREVLIAIGKDCLETAEYCRYKKQDEISYKDIWDQLERLAKNIYLLTVHVVSSVEQPDPAKSNEVEG